MAAVIYAPGAHATRHLKRLEDGGEKLPEKLQNEIDLQLTMLTSMLDSLICQYVREHLGDE